MQILQLNSRRGPKNITKKRQAIIIHGEPLSSKRVKDWKDPKYQKPFKFGWKREVVQRSTSDRWDTYYQAPNGEKLRTKKEINAYCK